MVVCIGVLSFVFKVLIKLIILKLLILLLSFILMFVIECCECGVVIILFVVFSYFKIVCLLIFCFVNFLLNVFWINCCVRVVEYGYVDE